MRLVANKLRRIGSTCQAEPRGLGKMSMAADSKQARLFEWGFIILALDFDAGLGQKERNANLNHQYRDSINGAWRAPMHSMKRHF